MDNKLLYMLSHFRGFNDIDKSFRKPFMRDADGKFYSDLEEIENLDIDNQSVLSVRPGSSAVKLSGTNIHSMWSDEKDICLFMDGTVLYKLNFAENDQDYTQTSLLTTVSSRMDYAQWNDRVYMTNNTYIGYFNNEAVTAVPDPDINYKVSLPAGQRVAYYKGRLYVAKGKVLYISDALCDHYDVRTGFRVFENNITMLRAVDKGLYVADGKTWFIPGAEPDEFQKVMVLDVDAVPFTDRLVNGMEIKDGIDGNVAMWVSEGGICIGDSQGSVKDLTGDRYNMGVHVAGSSVLRNVNGVVHYITTLQ